MYLVTPVPAAARSKVWVCDRSLAEVTGSISAGATDDRLLGVLCAVRYRFLRRADHFSRGIL